MSLDRRGFLDPRQAALVAGPILAALDDAAPAESEVALVRLGWRAMATRWELALPFVGPGCQPGPEGASGGHDAPPHASPGWQPVATKSAPEAVGRDVFDLLDRLEDQLTVYRDHSEVSRLNRAAPRRAVRVEKGLFELLRLAGDLWAETDGAFDAASGPLIKAWGFFRGPRRVPPPDELEAARERVGWRHVTLDAAARSVRFAVDGVEINLGSIGKGYALDRLADRLARRWKIASCLLHGGRSSVYAKGDPHGTGRGWAVDIKHPWRPGRTLARVRLRDRALGTSAATFQYLEHEGRKLGHVLDPRTGWPASGLASASVIAPSAALADALSTAFYVGGVELARRYCRAHPEVGAVLLPEGADSPLIVGRDTDVVLPDR